MRPLAQADGHSAPRLVDEAVPGEAAMVEDVVIGFEDAIREPVVAHELPDVFHRVQFGAFRWQRQQRDVLWHDECCGAVPSGLIEEQHGVGSRRDRRRDFRQMQRHPRAVAAGQDERRTLALGRTDRTVNVGRRRTLILRS